MVVAETIARAQKMNVPIFFDNTDYLFLKSRRAGRLLSKEVQAKRARLIMNATDNTTIPIAITSHDEEWAKKFLDLRLQEEYCQVLDRFPQYVIPINLQSEASIHRFLLDHNIAEPVVAYLLRIMSEDEQFSALKTSPVLKEVIRTRAEETISLVDEILASQNRDVKKQRVFIELRTLILDLGNRRTNLTKIRIKKYGEIKYVKDNLKNVLVFADESAATLADAKKVIRKKVAHGINIKLQKAGGIWPGKQIALLCQKAGFKIMVGSMLEGPISITAGVHFAISTPNVLLTDLDMDLDMPEHTAGEAKFINGKRILSSNNGLGVVYHFRRMRELEKKGLVIFEKIL